jgi:hypothetical protein
MKMSDKFPNRWIAYFDVMGFSKRVNESMTEGQLYLLMGDYQKWVRIARNRYSKRGVTAAWFSDSFLFYSKGESKHAYDALRRAACNFFDGCTMDKLPLRGAITYGELWANKREGIYVGKGLVEAVKHADSGKPFRLLMVKSAVDQARKIGFTPENHRFKNRKMPLKGNEGQLAGSLLYTFFPSSGGGNFRNPLPSKIQSMKQSAPKSSKKYYDDASNLICDNPGNWKR